MLDQITLLLSCIFTGILGGLLRLFRQNTDFLVSENYLAAINFFFYLSLKIFLLLCIVIFIASIIRSFFSPEKTRKMLGEGKAKGIIGNVFAALLGIVTPFCTCSAVSVFIGFIEAGVPLGVTFSFLISSPMVNEVALVMLWGLFGWKIALLYILTGTIVAVLSGLLIGSLKMERYVEEYVYKIKIPDVELDELKWKQRSKYALSKVSEILKKVWLYIFAGVAIGAAMHGWAPEGWLARYAGRDNPFAVILAVLVGIPLYSNAAGTIPIVKELTRLGTQMGTALSFMMAVTALSLPEIIILRKVIKPLLLSVFVGILAVTIIAIGYMFNGIIG
jgi:uncharacterized protein